MAGIAMMVGGALVNGLAFAGTNKLFKLFDKNGAEIEAKRHNLAQEKLNEETSKWEEHRKQVIDFVNQQQKKENQAVIDFRNVDNSLMLYNEMYQANQVAIPKKPQLSDFYTPSKEMMNYEYLWIILGLSGVGITIYMLY